MSVTPTVNPLVEKYSGLVSEANSIGGRYRAETGELSERVDSFINTTDDENIVKTREWIAAQREKIAAAESAISEREAAIREVAEAAVSEASDFDAEAAEKQFLALRKEITAMRKGFEAFGMEVPEIEEIVSLKSRTARQGGDGRGAGVSRSSFSSVSVDGTDLEKPTLSVAATLITKNHGKVSAGELRDSLSQAHGDVSEKYGEEFTFSHTVTGKNNESKTVTLVVVPTENVRRQPKSDDADSE